MTLFFQCMTFLKVGLFGSKVIQHNAVITNESSGEIRIIYQGKIMTSGNKRVQYFLFCYLIQNEILYISIDRTEFFLKKGFVLLF